MQARERHVRQSARESDRDDSTEQSGPEPDRESVHEDRRDENRAPGHGVEIDPEDRLTAVALTGQQRERAERHDGCDPGGTLATPEDDRTDHGEQDDAR